MAKEKRTFTISVLSAEGIVYYGECSVLFVPAEHDIIAVLPNHTPMIAMLGSGVVSIKTGREKQSITTINRGLLYVGDNEVTVLVNL